MVDEVRTSDGLRLAVREHGDPSMPTVVAVHGYPDDRHVWDDVVADLVVDHHVVTYDVRGAGGSQAPRRRDAYRIDRLAADLAAVIDAVSPDAPVHLLAHDWGSVQSWHLVTDPDFRDRLASYTSISGPCLDHIGRWFRTAPARERRRQARRSWYISFFRLPVVPVLAWRSGIFGAVLARRERIARPSIRTAVNGLELYRANIGDRVRSPQRRVTSVPTQVLAPHGDAYVGPSLAHSAETFASPLWVREVAGTHWLPRTRPDVVARAVREIKSYVDGGPEPARARKVVVVTGAGSGIGRETARAFAARGAFVVGADVDLDAAAATAAATGGVAYALDVADADAVEQFAADVAKVHGVPDVVVNNAGIGMAGPFTATTEEEWRRIVDVNLWGVVHGCRAFVPLMQERGAGGSIVNVASAAAFLPHRSMSAYATTKAAVLALSQSLRAELADDGIGVTALCPGFVHTDITATSRFAGQDPEAEQRSRDAATEAYRRRNYTPDRVATKLVRAVEKDLALAPVTAEAHVGLLASRLAPGLIRAIAKRGG
ncbi:short chain dehydrogenase [Pseudonocardia sulfidoxydans NBRC 16205]|uniref:Short chain dehydrogenase n=1 Tax=Pseudonocardia sulfidoxydans NBRC 16205 TaxID=1223511 RepID=A0A511DMB4_9PSEU|nr:SDR family oxidoreductase [Pseudonocardia sulfidoxydans]GEL25952.1 short chain dehydrogenase [Pseudonocardia sulfidoxydans NBRC 16205]